MILVYGGSAGSKIEVIDIGSPNMRCDFNNTNDISFGMIGFVYNTYFIVCGPNDKGETKCKYIELSEINAMWKVSDFNTLVNRSYAAIMPLGTGQYWITGGEMPSNPNMEAAVLKSTEIFKNNRFTFGLDLAHGTHSHCMVKVISSHFITAGGKTTETVLDNVYIIHFGSSKNWTALPSMAFKRFGHSCGITEEVLVVTGGLYMDSTEIFSFERQEW